MSTPHNIGQTIICGIGGTTLTAKEKKFLSKNKIGGVILFTKNYKNPKQLIELTASLKKIDSKMFISVDYEGGLVQRFKEPFSKIPAAYILGKGSSRNTFKVNEIAAKELSKVGINLNFAPCADIYKRGKLLKSRSFGKDKKIVSRHVVKVIEAMQKNKILACAKHFPGHGITSLDTHTDLPYSRCTLKTLQDSLYPFKMAIKNKVAMIMLAHIVCQDSDDLPVSFSHKYVSFLRNRLKYPGLIITDDLRMDAIQISDIEIPKLFFAAGGDILLTRDQEQAETFISSMHRYRIVPRKSISRILKSKKFL